MNFEINGEQYFLAFVENERRWFVFSPRPEGLHRMPVYIDAVTYERTFSQEPFRKSSD